MDIYTGEIYGKQTTNKFVMYHVLKISKTLITLQNIDNPQSILETTASKLGALGFIRVSQTPFVNTAAQSKKNQTIKKPTRCPHTLDFLEARADNERPAPILPDLFS